MHGFVSILAIHLSPSTTSSYCICLMSQEKLPPIPIRLHGHYRYTRAPVIRGLLYPPNVVTACGEGNFAAAWHTDEHGSLPVHSCFLRVLTRKRTHPSFNRLVSLHNPFLLFPSSSTASSKYQPTNEHTPACT